MLNSEPYTDRLFSNKPAIWIDNLLLIGPTFGKTDHGLKGFAARITSLFISITIFPLALAADFIHYGAKTIYNRSFTILSRNPESKAKFEMEAAKCHEIAAKCFKGFIASPLGIIWRDIVSNHYLPEAKPDNLIHPTGRLYTANAEIKTPESSAEVQQIVIDAINDKRQVSIAGAGFSQGRQTLPAQTDNQPVHINMSKMNKVKIDVANQTAIVDAGATWGDIQNAADKHKLAVQVMQASNVFSVGGSLSANCHGWDHIAGSLGNTVNWITIVDADGFIKTLYPHDEQFKLVVAGWGMFGVILQVELKLISNENLFDSGKNVPIKDYVKYFNDEVVGNPNIKMHLYRLSLATGKLLQEGIAQNYTTQKPGVTTENLVDEPARGTMTDRILMQVVRNSAFVRTLYWKRERKNLATIKEATRNQIMRPSINAAFATNSNSRTEWLQEYFLPGERLAEFVEFLGSVLDENEVALFNASVRFVKKDERSTMGYATKGDRFAVVLFFSQSLNPVEIERTKAWVQKVVDKVNEMDGAFYLPYGHFATKEQFQQSYPHKQINEAKNKYDPNGVFSNGLYADYVRN